MIRAVLFVALCAFAAMAAAKDPSAFPRKFKPVQFPQVVEEIERQIGAGGEYELKDDAARESVRADLQVMGGLLEGQDSLEAMREEDRIALFNAQERINATIKDNRLDRMECSQREIVGTRLKTTTCETAYDKRRREEHSREEARRLTRRILPRDGN